MTTLRHLAAFVLCALAVSFTAHAADNLKAFPPPDEGMVRRGDPQRLRYNSQLPLVVYGPKDVQVRYRISRASHLIQRAKQG